MSRPRPPQRNSVTVEIAGERHVIRSDAAPEYTHAVAAHLDQTIKGLGPAGSLEPHRTAIVAAMVITDELFRTRDELRLLREELDRRAGILADLLERAATEAQEGQGGS